MHRILIVLLIFLMVYWVAAWWRGRQKRGEKEVAAAKPKAPRVLKPRTPEDCGECRREGGREVRIGVEQREVRPWKEGKSRRGRKKRIRTEGHACPTESCDYYGITDENIHALVGYGSHGKVERIRDLRCQACKTKFSVRRDTMLYQLKTPKKRVGEVLGALAEGLDVAAAERVFGHTEATIQRWLTRAGMQAEEVQRRLLQGLELKHVQLDELKTRLRERTKELWLWVAMDVQTKVIPVVELGARTQERANRLIHRLREITPRGIPAFTSDGLDMYFYALTAHWGEWEEEEGKRKPRWVVAAGLLYGQVKKVYRRRKVVDVEYRMQWGNMEAMREYLKGLGLSGRLNTAFIERVNLTIRQAVGPLIRRTWGTAQTEEGLRLHIEWWRGYYHFVRPHMALREELLRPVARKGRQIPQRYRQRTPAMAVGVTNHRWTMQELISYPLPRGIV